MTFSELYAAFHSRDWRRLIAAGQQVRAMPASLRACWDEYVSRRQGGRHV